MPESTEGEGAEVMQLFSASADVFWGLSLSDFTAVAKERKKPSAEYSLLSLFCCFWLSHMKDRLKTPEPGVNFTSLMFVCIIVDLGGKRLSESICFNSASGSWQKFQQVT